MSGTDVLTILFVIFAAICFMGMAGDKDRGNRSNFTLGYIVSVAAAVLLHIRK